MMKLLRGNDRGVTLVELLIGLAIASMLAMALGGLLTFSVQAKDSVDRASAVTGSLIELEISADLLDRLIPVNATLRLDRQSNALSVWAETPNTAPQRIRIELQSADDQGSALVLSDDKGHDIGPVSLAVFDTVEIDFLVLKNDRLAWIPAAEARGGGLLGMRLLVEANGRHWPVLLWASRARRSA